MTRKNKSILIGEGNDFVEQWYCGFEIPMDSITDRLLAAESFDFPIDWGKVLHGLTDVDEIRTGEVNIYTSNELGIFFKYMQNAFIENERWGGDSLGRSDSRVKIYVLNSNLKSILRKMSCISGRLNRYWERHIFRQRDQT